MKKTLLSFSVRRGNFLLFLLAAVATASAEERVRQEVPAQRITESLVASPQSAADADWFPVRTAGGDFHLALSPEWRKLKGVSEEEFVKKASPFHVKVPVARINSKSLRTGIIREVELLDEKGRNIAPSVRFTFRSTEEQTVFLHPQNINDRDPGTLCVFTGDSRRNKLRYKKVYGTLQLSAPENFRVSAVRIYHGNAGNGALEGFSLLDPSGKKLETASMKNIRGTFSATLKKPESCRNIAIGFSTVPYKLVIRDLPPETEEKARTMPFEIQDIVRMNSNNFLGLSEENFDRRSFRKFLDTYRDTFMGFGISEFDSNYQQLRIPGSANFSVISGYIPRKDRDRADAEKNMRNLFLYQKELLFNHVYTLSGGVMGSPYFAEWGSRNLILEYSCRLDRSARILMTMTKSAGRQYHVPWGFYMAYYAAVGHPNSTIVSGNAGVDYGQAPSHGLRTMLMNYYMGGNYQWFESQPWGQVIRKQDGSCELTENGKAIKTFFDWTRKAEGRRGFQYTPILFLLDYLHGQTGRPNWKVWYFLPMEDGDFMAKHFFDTISPLDPQAKFAGAPQHCINIANSPIGDIYDIFFANAPSGEVTVEELGKYAIVIAADNIRFTEKLKKNLKEYVSSGGTLVLNSGHLPHFRKEPAFLGFRSRNTYTPENDMKLADIQCTSAKTVLASPSGKPLIVKNRFGKGNVLFTTPYFLLLTDRKSRSPLIGQLLEKLQEEVLPVGVSGDIHFILSRMKDRSWKLVLMNNRGVSKEPLQTEEKRFPAYDSTVKITLPDGAEAKEIFASAEMAGQGNVCTVKVPAGEARIVEIRNVKFGTPLINADAPVRKPQPGKWVDSCREEALPKPSASSRKLLAEWTFDEGSGEIVRDKVNGSKIRLHHQPQFVKTPNGYALKFDGKKTYGRGSFPIEPDHFFELSVECWVKPDISPGSAWSTRAGKRQGFVFYGGPSSFAMGISGNQWNQTISYDGYVSENILDVENGKWAHLVFTWKDSLARFYVNGVEAVPRFGAFKLSGLTLSKNFPVWLGSHYYNPGSGRSNVFNGLIDNLRYYNYALDEQEIRRRCREEGKKYQAETNTISSEGKK